MCGPCEVFRSVIAGGVGVTSELSMRGSEIFFGCGVDTSGRGTDGRPEVLESCNIKIRGLEYRQLKVISIHTPDRF
jgi:hypothetical protein